jgi:uncharacterized protein (DUF1330 family)
MTRWSLQRWRSTGRHHDAILIHAEATDPDEYEHFQGRSSQSHRRSGGRYLVRAGAGTSLEGDFGSRVILFEFPSYQDALNFYQYEAYQAAREIRCTPNRGSLQSS